MLHLRLSNLAFSLINPKLPAPMLQFSLMYVFDLNLNLNTLSVDDVDNLHPYTAPHDVICWDSFEGNDRVRT